MDISTLIIIQEELRRIRLEQTDPAPVQPDSASNLVFSDSESAFLKKFAELKSEYIGYIYSNSDIGILEFIGRSGKDLNLSLSVLHDLIKKNIIEVIPYGGYGRDENFTIHLKIGLDNVQGLGGDDINSDKEDSPAPEPDAGGDTEGGDVDTDAVESGLGAPGGAAEPESTTEGVLKETEWNMNYEDVLRTSAKVAHQLAEKGLDPRITPQNAKPQGNLKFLPPGYLYYLDRIIKILGSRLKASLQREHLIADIMVVLANQYGLKPKQIYRAYIFYKAKNKLQNIIKKQ